MSKEKPEVGDVWECNGQKMIVIGVSGYFHPLCIKKDGKEFEESWLFLDVELTYNYLGKSKVNLDDLFDVERRANKKRHKVLSPQGIFY